MEQGFIRWDDQTTRKDWMPILEAVYTYEASNINGAHGGKRRLSQYAWTVERMLVHLKSQIPSRPPHLLLAQLTSMMDELRANRQLLTLKISNSVLDESQDDWRVNLNVHELDLGELEPSDDGNGNITVNVTRMAELVRTTGNVREYSRPHNLARRTMIESTTWTPVLRPSLNRNLPPQTVVDELRLLASPTTTLQNFPSITLAEALDDLECVLEALRSPYAMRGAYEISEFQKDGIVAALKQAWFGVLGHAGESGGVVVAAGTGFGKTLAFAIPVLVDALIQTREPSRACSQVLLYPRNDLALDQFSELRNYVRALNDFLEGRGETHRNFGIKMDAGGKITDPADKFPGGHQSWGNTGDNVYQAANTAYAGNSSTLSASIMVASVESFRRRLSYPPVVNALGESLKRVVIDEIHLNSGIQGAHLQRIMKRIRQLTWHQRRPRDIVHVIGASATIANPEGHLSAISHVKQKHVVLIEAQANDDDPIGLMNHVLMQPRKGRSTIGSVVDASSALTHQRRGKITVNTRTTSTDYSFPERPPQAKDIQKTVGFSDGHEIVGSWWNNFVRNEMTEEGKPSGEDVENPYPHRHFQPLRLQGPEAKKVCDSCTTGCLAPAPISVNESDLWVFKYTTDGAVRGFDSPTGLPSTDIHQISGLGTCPHLEYGTCWWFVERDDIDAMESFGTKEYNKNVIRSFRHTSKTREDISTAQGADQNFKRYGKKTAYPEQNFTQPQAKEHDFAIATPTLEVGIDMNNVTEVMTHKAIRNVSSYRQKVGRAGREMGTDAVAVTVLAKNATETNHLRSPSKLVLDSIKDPVPVANENEAVEKNQAYEAVWDFLAINGHSIELIPGVRKNQAAARQTLVDAFKSAKTAAGGSTCRTYVQHAVGCSEAIAREAGEYAALHLGLLLKENNNFIDPASPPDAPTNIEWVAARRARDNYQPRPDPNSSYQPNPAYPSINLWKELNKLLPTIETLLSPNVQDALAEKHVNNLQAWSSGTPPPAPPAGVPIPVSNAFRDFVAYCNLLVPALPHYTMSLAVERIWRKDEHKVCAYLSSILREAFALADENGQGKALVGELHESVPYISLAALFTNPSEQAVMLNRKIGGGQWDSVPMTMKEALTFVLPGMWTHRAWGAGCYFATHSRDLSPMGGDVYLMRFDDNEKKAGTAGLTLGPSAAHVPRLLPLNVNQTTQQYRLNYVHMERDEGANNRKAMMVLAEVDGDQRFSSLEATAVYPQRYAKRPDSYAVSWVLAQPPEHTASVQTYTPYNLTLVDTSTPPASPTVQAAHHPLFYHAGMQVEMETLASITRMGLGVSRANGVLLQPSINESPIVWTDTITTPALRFTVPIGTVERIVAHYLNPDRPFDKTVLLMFGHYAIQELDFAPFNVRPFLDAMLAVVYNNPAGGKDLPDTRAEAFDRWFNQGRIVDATLAQEIAEHHLPDNPEQVTKLVPTLLELYDLFMDSKCWTSFDDVVRSWACTNLGNSLGMMLKELTAELSGVQAPSVGYTFSFDAEAGLLVTVFDDDAAGNGCVELAQRYFHMPSEAREAAAYHGDGQLPNQSFLDLVEERLKPCSNHIASTVAINGSNPTRVPELTNVINDLINRHKENWSKSGVSSTRTANLLSRLIPILVADDDALDASELEDAFAVCDHGCDECQSDAASNLFSPVMDHYTQSREVLELLLLGAESMPAGYKRETTDRATILAEAGTRIGSMMLGAHNDDDGREIIKNFVRSTGARVMMHWPRRSDHSNVDWLVRTHEVMD